ncbi:MAG: amidase [Amphritea sp.]
MTNLIYADIAELGSKLRNNELSAVDLAQAYFQRIEELNPQNPVFISQCKEQALHEAEYTQLTHPLSGIPFSCKDLYQTKGLKTTGGSRVMEDHVSEEDAYTVQLLKQQGAILQGKNNLHEFAYGATGVNAHFGTVTNPYNSSRLAGGSSSGSAAAVALGMSAFALGTDTGGSVRAPAALCGVVGLKPTLGRISLRGVVPYCWTLDHVGTFTRNVKDAALLMDVLGVYDAQDSSCVNTSPSSCQATLTDDIRGKKIGIPSNFFFDHCDPEILAATHQAIGFLEQQGAEIIPVEMPSMEHTRTVSLTVQLPEALSYHSDFLAEKRELYSDEFRSGFAAGQFILAEHYVRAKRLIEGYRQQLQAVFNEVDVLITPGCPTIAPPVDTTLVETAGKTEPAGNAITRYTSFFNMTGNPAITLPTGLHSSGLPMSVQLVANLFDEATLLNLAYQLEGRFGTCQPPA